MTENEDAMRHWGEELARARRAANYPRRVDLAKASRVSKGTIDALEQGTRLPRQETLAALRRVLPDLRLPLDISPMPGDERDPNGYVVHLPMDPDARMAMLAELMQRTVAERTRSREP